MMMMPVKPEPKPPVKPEPEFFRFVMEPGERVRVPLVPIEITGVFDGNALVVVLVNDDDAPVQIAMPTAELKLGDKLLVKIKQFREPKPPVKPWKKP
jgi:hypothetical protein